ncbi:MAG: NAD(P)-dependent alcohol dehydrogenase [bacterium]|nr:NAD(P)-dependent alcohol dehydrogenase [bacterium]
MAPWSLERRDPRPDDVAIDIMYCGVCHSDLHFVENDWGWTIYPVVPGHEIVGRVTSVGSDVTKFKEGDIVGVGCMVDSCRECESCNNGLEQYCTGGNVFTYNGEDKHDGSITYGGYSDHVVVSDRFVVKVPDGMDPANAAPMLCAGITTFSPLRHVGVKKGDRVGVVGMGGLGHLGIKFARAMGAEVIVFTRSKNKVEEAKSHGACEVVVTGKDGAFDAVAGSLDYVLDTVPVNHDYNPYISTLKIDGTYIIVGQLTPLETPIEPAQLILGRCSIIGSAFGGMPETQEVLDFAAEHGVTCDIEMLDIKNINEAYERMKRSDVRYRFVIDMETIKG